ncbi:outer membrane beta-barrel family protein [Aquimarina sp. AU474]|uniref:outer membrane beta-barrel family protein n=1 Tax=Aquimarina sp. AU474 TaxID=2108529 RepID=UPI000D69922C|nr:outer membrane beta-barrel family protein [Aquimarina sp. AU474]
MKKQITILLFLIFWLPFFAQETYDLSGKVTDQNGNLIEAGDVLLQDKARQGIISYTFIAKGQFNLNQIPKGNYLLSVSCLGYIKETLEINLQENRALSLQLTKSLVALDQVTINSSKNTFNFKDGNIKINVENSIFESLPSTTDLLSKLPGVQISPNQETLSIIGRGSPLLYLDNQRIDFDQLKSISLSDIKEVEIIDNPPAKYEAEGKTLILITGKRSKKEGYKIDISETVSFKRKFSNYFEMRSDFKRKKLELQANINYNQIGFWENSGARLEVPLQNITSEYNAKAVGPRPQLIMGSGFFYQFNKYDYLSGRINYRTQRDRFPIVTNTLLRINEVEDFILSESSNDAPRSFLTSNINYNRKLNTKSNLFFGIQYSNYSRDLKSSIFNNFNQTGFQLSQNRNQTYQIGAFASRIDFENEISKHIKIEIGGSISKSTAIAFSDFELINPDQRIISTYDYNEDTYSSYTQLSGSLHKINYNAGIRIETNIVKGGFRNTQDLLVDREQTLIFPKMKLNIPIDSTKALKFNYNKTINRPGYLNASSISTFINPLIEFVRNVNLSPTITEEISTDFIFKKSNLSLRYFETQNPIFFSSIYNSQEGRIITSPQNFNQETGYAIQFRNTLNHKAITSTNVISLTYSKIKDPFAVNQKTEPYVYYYSNTEFKIKPKITTGINFWGLSKRYQGIFERNAVFILGVSFTKSFYNNLQFSLNANDILRNMNFEDKYTANDIVANDVFYVNAQELSFSLKYSFGKTKKLSFKNKDIDDNLNRIR